MMLKLISMAKNSKYKPLLKKVYRSLFKQYPYIVGDEINTVKSVLKSGIWNMSNSDGIHSVLEKEFAEYIGVKHAIVVNTGGVAIQMALRVLDVKLGDEVIHQVDTCVANAFAIMNAGVTPIFSDISLDTFKLDFENLDQLVTTNTKVIMPIHVWGNVENMDAVKVFAKKYNLKIIEDCALSFGAEYNGEKVGKFGDIGIFSFGSTKPIQAGEGGIIVTNDDVIAKKLRAMRMWGEMTQEYGIRDHEILSWNGRTSEIVVAVMLEQFRNYENRYKSLQNNVNFFINELQKIDGIRLADSNIYNTRPTYSQVVLRLDMGIDKMRLMQKLKDQKLAVWHANFEPIPTISFFKNNTWKEWMSNKNIEYVDKNYHSDFLNSINVYHNLGLGFMPSNFLTLSKTKNTLKVLKMCLKDIGRD